MNSYVYKIELVAIMTLSLLVMSCSESTETQLQNDINDTANDVINTGDVDPVIPDSLKPVVALSSKQVDVNVGESFELEVTMSDFPVSEGGGVTVKFDASKLSVSNVTIDSSVWGFVNKVGGVDNDAGVISDILFSSYNGVSGDSNIATIQFNAIGNGSSQIYLEGSTINPFASSSNTIAVSFISTNVQVGATK